MYFYFFFRTCSGVKRVYILIREKKGKTTEERFKDLFNDPVSKHILNMFFNLNVSGKCIQFYC